MQNFYIEFEGSQHQLEIFNTLYSALIYYNLFTALTYELDTMKALF